MIRFSTENLSRVFAKPENDFEGFRQMLKDFAAGKAIYDEDGNKVSKDAVNAKINAVVFDIQGLDPESKPTKRDINRAMKHHGQEVFEVLEEAIDWEIEYGWGENEFFNEFVDRRNIAAGDRIDFYVDDPNGLIVAQVSGDHHDLTMQRLGEGEVIPVPTQSYGVKVGMDIDVYLLGRKDWSELVRKVAVAYQKKIQEIIFDTFYGAADEVPAQFKETGAISAATKPTFDELIANIEAANGTPVAIFGLKTDLKKLAGFADVNWISERQKDEVAELGRLGSYEGTTIVEIPNRYKDATMTEKMIEPGTLLIMPVVDNRFVKFVDAGEVEIFEQTEKGDRKDDIRTYEVQREMGAKVVMNRYFGVWTITG